MGWIAKARGAAIAALLSDTVESSRGLLPRMRRRVTRGRKALRLYYGVSDPYSYLLLQLLRDIGASADAALEVVPVPRPPALYEPEAERRAAYSVVDAARLARRHGLTFGGNTPLSTELEQRVACIIAGADDVAEAALAASGAAWRGDDAALSDAERDHGIRGREQANAITAAGAAALLRAGHYSPGMVQFDGQWYWGVDRLSYLCDALGVPLHLEEQATRPDSGADGDTPIELFFSFRSPYSYLSLEPTAALARKYGRRLVLRPVLPMVMRGFKVPFRKRLYIVRDCKREADRLGIPFGRICDPLGPGIARCNAATALAAERGRDIELAISLGRGIWSEALDVTNDRDMARMVERSELPWPDVRAALDADHDSAVEQNRQDLLALGLWGVPSFSFGSLAAWGQDRLWLLEDALRASADA